MAIQDFSQQLEKYPDDIEAKKILAEIFLKNNDTKNLKTLLNYVSNNMSFHIT